MTSEVAFSSRPAAVEPAALEASLAAVAGVERQRAEPARPWHLRRERAAIEVDRACRQYQACEPENRLAARELERRWGEFGRTPQINKDAGRDHWPLVRGGFRTEQVIGATDRIGATITKRPVHFGEVHATLYHYFGIDPHAVTLPDFSGRSHSLVGDWKALPEVI